MTRQIDRQRRDRQTDRQTERHTAVKTSNLNGKIMKGQASNHTSAAHNIHITANLSNNAVHRPHAKHTNPPESY